MVADVITEIVSDKNGEVLWFANYPFSKLQKKGEEFVHDYISYKILSSILVGRSIKTVVVKLP